MAALLTGFVLGMGRLVMEINKSQLDGFLLSFASVNFLHFAIILFVVCTAVLVMVSLLTPPPPVEKVAGLTLDTRAPAPGDTGDRRWRRTDLILSVVLVISVGLLWWYFSN